VSEACNGSGSIIVTVEAINKDDDDYEVIDDEIDNNSYHYDDTYHADEDVDGHDNDNNI